MTTPTRFEDRLLDQLRQVVAERPAPAVAAAGPRRRPRPSRLALAGVGVGAVAAAVIVAATSSDVTTSAYAVEPRADGSVTVHIHNLSDAAGLQSKLRAAGIPAVVDYVPGDKAGCVGPGPAAGSGSGPTTVHGAKGVRTVHSSGSGKLDSGPSLSTAGGPGGSAAERGTTSAAGAGSAGAGAVRMMTRVAVNDDGVTFTIDPGNIPSGQNVFITTSTGRVNTIGMAIGAGKPGKGCVTTGGPLP